MMAVVLEKTGETVWDQGMMYEAVVQSLILYESGRWVMTGERLNFLEGFHHLSERWITGITATRGAGGDW